MNSREAFIQGKIKRFAKNQSDYDKSVLAAFIAIATEAWQAAEAQFKPVAYRQTIEVHDNETSRTEYGYSDIQIMNSDLTLYAKSEA